MVFVKTYEVKAKNWDGDTAFHKIVLAYSEQEAIKPAQKELEARGKFYRWSANIFDYNWEANRYNGN